MGLMTVLEDSAYRRKSGLPSGQHFTSEQVHCPSKLVSLVGVRQPDGPILIPPLAACIP